jgi:hypothetical protein
VSILPKQQPRSVFLKEAKGSFSRKPSDKKIEILPPRKIGKLSYIMFESWRTSFSNVENLQFCYAMHGFYDTVFIFQTDHGVLYEVVTYEVTPYQLINKPASPIFYSQLTPGTNSWRCYGTPFFYEADDCTILYMDQTDSKLRCTYLIETTTNFIEIAAPEPMQIKKLEGITAEERILEIVEKYGYDLEI